MNDLKDEIKEEAKTLADNTVHPDHETEKEADKRQPWMPIVGALLAALILFSVYFFFVM